MFDRHVLKWSLYYGTACWIWTCKMHMLKVVFKRASKEIWLILIGVYGGIIHDLWGECLILIWPMWCHNILYFNKLVFTDRGLGFRGVLFMGREDLLFWALIVYTRSPLSILYTNHFFQIKVVRKWWGHFWLSWVLAKKCAKISSSVIQVGIQFASNLHPSLIRIYNDNVKSLW